MALSNDRPERALRCSTAFEAALSGIQSYKVSVVPRSITPREEVALLAKIEPRPGGK